MNVCKSNNRALKPLKQKLAELKEEIDNLTNILTLLSQKLVQKLDKKIIKTLDDLNNTMKHLDIIDICITQHPTTIEYTIFSSTHSTITRIDDTLSHKICLNS